MSVERIGATSLRIDMACAKIRRLPNEDGTEVQMCFANATANNCTSLVTETVVKKLQTSIAAKLVGLQWGSQEEMNGLKAYLAG